MLCFKRAVGGNVCGRLGVIHIGRSKGPSIVSGEVNAGPDRIHPT